MAALSNQKHERFAQQMALPNAEQRPAYITAGFRGKTKRSQESAASNLMRRPDIQARVAELKRERERDLAVNVERVIRDFGPLDDGVFTRVGRARVLAQHRKDLLQVKADRAAAPENQNLPGGKTGFVVIKGTKTLKHRVLQHSKDPSVKPTEVERLEKTIIAAVDTKFISALLAVDEQIARELGQWVEKTDGTLAVRKISDLTDEELRELIKDGDEMVAKEAAKKANTPESIQ